jgi:hypothetical protein
LSFGVLRNREFDSNLKEATFSALEYPGDPSKTHHFPLDHCRNFERLVQGNLASESGGALKLGFLVSIPIGFLLHSRGI